MSDIDRIKVNGAPDDFKKIKNKILSLFVPSDETNANKEKTRFGNILNNVLVVPAGMETLKALAEKTPPFKICFESLKENAWGVCKGNKIAISPNLPDNLLAPTLVHEATHAALQDFSDDMEIFGVSAFTAASIFKQNRVKEADACAKAALFVHQCQKNKRTEPIYIASMNNGERTYLAFDAAMKRGASEREALRESFLEWAKRPSSVRFYDKGYEEYIVNAAQNEEACGRRGAFSMNLSDGDVMKICTHKGEPYIEEEDLHDPYFRGIEVARRNKIQSALDNYAEHTGSKRDASLLTMAPVSSYEDRLKHDAEAQQRREEARKRAAAARINQKTGNVLNNAFSHSSADRPKRKFSEHSYVDMTGMNFSNRPSLMETLCQINQQRSHTAPSSIDRRTPKDRGR